MQPPLDNKNQYNLPQLNPAAPGNPTYAELNNWQVMNNLGKFNAGQFGNAAANAVGAALAYNANQNGVQGNGNDLTGTNEVAALNEIFDKGGLGNPDVLVGRRENNNAILTHYFLHVLGVGGNRGGANNDVDFHITTNDIFNGNIGANGRCGGNAWNGNAAQCQAHINTHANGFFVWLQQVISADVAQVPLETKQVLLKTIKQTLQGKTVVANNAAAPAPNQIKAKDAIVNIVKAIHAKKELTNLLPVNGWGVHQTVSGAAAANAATDWNNGHGGANGGSKEIVFLDHIRASVAAARAAAAALPAAAVVANNNNDFGAGAGVVWNGNAWVPHAAAANVAVAGAVQGNYITDGILNCIRWNSPYTGTNEFIKSTERFIKDPNISDATKKDFIAKLQNAQYHAALKTAGTYPTDAATYATFMNSVASEMARQFPGKFQIRNIGGGAVYQDATNDQSKQIELLYNTITDVTSSDNEVKFQNALENIPALSGVQKIQGGYDYDSGRAITPIQHAMHALSTCTDTHFPIILRRLTSILENPSVQAGLRQEDLAIAVKKFGNNDTKLAQVLEILIPRYQNPADLTAALREIQPYKELPNETVSPLQKIAAILQNDNDKRFGRLWKVLSNKREEWKNSARGDIFDATHLNFPPEVLVNQYNEKYKDIIPPAPRPFSPAPLQYDKIFDEIHGTNEIHRKKILKKMQVLYDKIKEDLAPDEQDDYKKALHKIASGNRHLKTAKGILGDLYSGLQENGTLERNEKADFKSIIGEIKHEINRNIKHDERHEDWKKHHHHEEKHHEKVNLKKLENDIFSAAAQAGVKKGNRRKVAKLIGEFVKENGAIRGITEKEHIKLHEKWDKFRIKNYNHLKDVNYKTACAFSAYFKKEHGKRLADIDPKDINATLKEKGR